VSQVPSGEPGNLAAAAAAAAAVTAPHRA
jgi:hypothetical protein